MDGKTSQEAALVEIILEKIANPNLRQYKICIQIQNAFWSSTWPSLPPEGRLLTLARAYSLLRVLGGFQRSPNEFIPVHKHLRSYRPRLTVWNLPEEIMIQLLKSLHVKDLLSMRAVHRYFRDLIDSYQSIWTCVTFQDSWPSAANQHHFEKAAELGNIEALVKLAVAYLYNEGLTGDNEGRKVNRNGLKAAEMFCRIESLTPSTDPFTWLFIRPPWSLNGACCKECVFNYMKDYVKKESNKKIQVCVAKTLQLLDDKNAEESCSEYLELAASQSSGIAAYMQWTRMKANLPVTDKAGELESIRKLRDIASLEHLDAKLQLCKYYAHAKYGGISKEKAMSFIQEFVHSVPALNTQDSFKRSQELTASMRYILVDWLAEVAAMKEFSSLTFHVAVSVVDRFLRVHPVTRSKLQLLGVSAMVLCSRFLGKDIITIREAAWLTDNTYKYEDVVRMMGEITATLKGSIRVATSVDFAEIFNLIVSHDRRMCYLTQYICELALLQAEMGQYSPAEVAASSVLLSRLLVKMDDPWPDTLQEATGFCIEDLSRCAFHMHEKCFLEGSVVDHRDVTLQAVKQRYADEQCYKVSEIEIISYQELCMLLGVTEHIQQGSDIHVKFRNDDELIVSPRRKRRKGSRNGPILAASTPRTLRTRAVEHSFSKSRLNDSILSGYDGDREDDLDESLISLDEIDGELGDCKPDIFSDEGMGSESDTMFANLSSDNARSPQKFSFNFSFSVRSPSHRLSFTNQNMLCDNPTTSSGVSSSQSSGCAEDEDVTSFNGSQSFSLFSSLKSTSMTLRSASALSACASGFLSSDSESNNEGASSSKRFRNSTSPKHMTLRDSTRKHRRQGSSNTKTYIFK